MPDPKDPRQDDHIEDLLGQLQGIFGRLSKTEQEEAEQKQDVPGKSTASTTPPPTAPAPPPAPAPEPPVVAEPPAPTPEPVHEPHAPLPDPFEAPPPAPPPPMAAPTPTPAPPSPDPVVQDVPPAPPSVTAAETPAPATAAPAPSGFESTAPQDPGDNSLLATAIFFPAGRENEAKTLGNKIETMTPKFTKVSFKLRVAVFQAYDPKSDWREEIVSKTVSATARAAFVVVNNALDDTRRKALAAEFEPRGIYFQEVPVLSVEKKAFYMDLLLGIVFFFDSLKPSAE